MVDLIEKKKYFFALSIILILAGIVGFIVNKGFNLDIQFQGGSVIEMQMSNDNFTAQRAEEVVASVINKKVTAQKSYTLNTKEAGQKMNFLIVNIASKDKLSGEEQTKVVDALRKEFNVPGTNQMTIRNIDPSIGAELKTRSMWAVFWSSLLIIIYIWFRFKVMSGLSAGVMAVLALFHDVLIMMSVYAIFKIPVNESFIAAMLTILGYSMNDTIIIYDRIRENSNLLRKMPIAELANRSILQTLARSINTVVTVLICLITVYIFSVYNNIGSLKEFILPLIVGIASGCYSSIFIASPLWVMWKERQNKKSVVLKTKTANL